MDLGFGWRGYTGFVYAGGLRWFGGGLGGRLLCHRPVMIAAGLV